MLLYLWIQDVKSIIKKQGDFCYTKRMRLRGILILVYIIFTFSMNYFLRVNHSYSGGEMTIGAWTKMHPLFALVLIGCWVLTFPRKERNWKWAQPGFWLLAAAIIFFIKRTVFYGCSFSDMYEIEKYRILTGLDNFCFYAGLIFLVYFSTDTDLFGIWKEEERKGKERIVFTSFFLVLNFLFAIFMMKPKEYYHHGVAIFILFGVFFLWNGISWLIKWKKIEGRNRKWKKKIVVILSGFFLIALSVFFYKYTTKLVGNKYWYHHYSFMMYTYQTEIWKMPIIKWLIK